jgi:hypothetical protein
MQTSNQYCYGTGRALHNAGPTLAALPVPHASAETTLGLDKIREQGIDLSPETMSLIRRKVRISAKQVAEILGCAENTVHNRGAGTHTLTRIRNGRRQIRFLLDEVTALAEMQENNSAGSGPNKKQEEYGHRRSLTL